MITKLYGNITHNILLAFILVLFASCSNNDKPKANPNIPPKFIEREPLFKKHGQLTFMNGIDTLATINIEIADTPEKTTKGLMYRKHMEDNNGMLFIFESGRRQTFWMRNTPISLDIIFINAEKEIVHIAPNTIPYSTKNIPSFEYAQYVVEVNAGYCQKHAITTGNKIDYKRQ